MANRVAGILALVAFAMCLLVGTFDAGNGFVVVVRRALLAMLCTYVVGYVVGIAAERMLSENVDAAEKRAVEKRMALEKAAANDAARDGPI